MHPSPPTDLTQWVALTLIKNLGGVTFRALLTCFDYDLDAILGADEAALRQVRGIGSVVARAIRGLDLNATDRAIDRWKRKGVHILTWHDAAYPLPLADLHDAPPTLFVLGNLSGLRALHGYAIVGTRHPSPLGVQMAEHLAGEVVRQGFTVVSGLAYGIDKTAHLSALAGGRTVAVLGSGVLNLYPPEHRNLAEAIQRQGALLCEVAPDAPVSTPGLVARNRIISGLSRGVFIVETEDDGGAMHAARFAKVQGRSLYAVDVAVSGNQALIASGDAERVAPLIQPLALE
ncbi:MAG: DNA-protecting protein DprA [bacterium]|nr:DNA-protecting protein DprA [bacterium]